MQTATPLELDQLETAGTLLERIRACKSLPVLSPLASKILSMSQDEEAQTSKLAELISQDPGMSVNILVVANSGYYGGGRHKVTSVMQAVQLLGFARIANLALSFSFYHLTKDGNARNTSAINHVQFWQRSIFSGVAGRAIGKHLGYPDTDLPFLAALLQDIGVLALNEVAADEIKAIQEHSPQDHANLCRLELEYLGVDHSQVGAWLAQQWDLPAEYQVAILYSHAPELLEIPSEFQSLVDVIALSGLIADIWMAPHTETAIATAQEKSQGRLPIQPEDWGPILDDFVTSITQIASFFHTKLPRTDEITRIYHLALEQLAPTYTDSTLKKRKVPPITETETASIQSTSWWNIHSRLRT